MSYDLRVTAPRGLDLEPLVAAGAEREGDELVWARETLVAQLLPLERAVEVGVAGDDAPPAARARDFRDLLELLLEVAARGGGAVHDPQLGRELGEDDVDAAVACFA
jgi:hypothetical protein